eukprot:COSAG05_NODE_3181_length_2264_cov_2.498383_1_plen_189_part_00
MGLTKGSIKVEFAVQPDTSGKGFETKALESKLAKNTTVSFKTLAADKTVLAADPNISKVKTVTLDADIKATVSEGPCKEGGSDTCGADATCTDKKDKFDCACKSGFTGEPLAALALSSVVCPRPMWASSSTSDSPRCRWTVTQGRPRPARSRRALRRESSSPERSPLPQVRCCCWWYALPILSCYALL